MIFYSRCCVCVCIYVCVGRVLASLGGRVITHPMHHLAPFESALKEYVLVNPAVAAPAVDRPVVHEQYHIGFEGHFGRQRMSPRQLQAQHLGQLVCVEGIASRCQWSAWHTSMQLSSFHLCLCRLVQAHPLPR